MIIKRTKIVDSNRVRANTLMKQITNMNTKTNIKNKNKLSEENSHACF